MHKANAIHREILELMGVIQWVTLEVSTSWVQEITPMSILLGGTIATCARMLMATSGGKLMFKKAT